MRARSLIIAAAAVSLVGCGSSRAPTPTPTAPTLPAAYVAAVQALLVPPARLATIAADRVRPTPAGPVPTRADIDPLLNAARRQLREFRAQRFTFEGMQRQRDALAGAYQATLAHMERVGDDLVRNDRTALIRHLPDLLNAMRGLSSAASSPGS